MLAKVDSDISFKKKKLTVTRTFWPCLDFRKLQSIEYGVKPEAPICGVEDKKLNFPCILRIIKSSGYM